MRHGSIPPSIHCQELNPAIPWDNIPCEIARERRDWPSAPSPRFAGVSAFGIAGTNGHVVLEQAPAIGAVAVPAVRRQVQLLPLSAKSPEALRALALLYVDLLSTGAQPALHNVCWNAATRRTTLDYRAVFVAGDRTGMADALRRYASGEAAAAEGVVRADASPRIAFVLPGQGAQWVGMARELIAREPAFRAALERCDQAARRFVDWSIMRQLAADPDAEDFLLSQIDVIQPVLVALAIAYAELLRSVGVEPDAVVGHSMGEVAAAAIAGALDLEQAMQVVCSRSALMRRVSGQGAMALVDLPMAELPGRLAGVEDRGVGGGEQRSAVECYFRRARSSRCCHSRTGKGRRVLSPGEGGCRITQPADGAAGGRTRDGTGRADGGVRFSADLLNSARPADRGSGARRKLLGAEPAAAGPVQHGSR